LTQGTVTKTTHFAQSISKHLDWRGSGRQNEATSKRKSRGTRAGEERISGGDKGGRVETQDN